MSKKTKRSISTFAILLAVMLLVSIATWLAAGKTYTGENGEMAEVVGASASDIFMGPVNGFADRKSTRLNSSHKVQSRMPSSA